MSSLARVGAGLAVAAALAACGASAVHKGALAPSGSVSVTNASAAGGGQGSTTAITPTPRSPLSHEPLVPVPTGPPPTKLVTKELITGTGAVAKPGDEVTLNYVGALYRGGKVFDSSWQRHQPSTTQLMYGSAISGWVKGIIGERVGGRRELVIPPNLAYGSAGNPPQIPSNSTLIFVVDLLSASPGSGDD